MQVGLGHLYSDIEHPYVVEAELTIVAAKNIQLSLDYVGCVSAARTRSVVTCLHFLPVVLLNVKDVDIIHPMGTVVASKVVDFRVDEAAGCGDSCARLGPCHCWFNPG